MNRTTNNLPPLLLRDCIEKLDETIQGIDELNLSGRAAVLRARSILVKTEARLSEELAKQSFEKVLAPTLRQEKLKQIDDEHGEDVDGSNE